MKKIIFCLFLAGILLNLSAQEDATFYSRVSAAVVYLRHEVFLDPALCRNEKLFRRWEADSGKAVLSAYFPLSSGSGFFVDSGRLILTNRHVVRVEDLEELRNRVANLAASELEKTAKSFTAEERRTLKLDLFAMITKGSYRFAAVSGGSTFQSPETVAISGDGEPDIAVLKVPGKSGAWLDVEMADRITAGIVGSEVFSIGYPLGASLEEIFKDVVATMNKGNISAVRDAALGIQHSAAISRGNSGGPLVNSSGIVVGMNTAVITEGNSLYLAVGADRIRAFLEKNGIRLPAPRATESGIPSKAAAVPEKSAGLDAPSYFPRELEVSRNVFVEGEAGAAIILDGEPAGTVPALIEIPAGISSLKVEGSRGFFTARLRSMPTLRGTSAVRADFGSVGNLVIVTNGDAVRVRIDGVDVGEFGRGLFTGLTVGRHRIELAGEGTYGYRAVEIPEGRTLQVEIPMLPAGKFRAAVPEPVLIRVKGASFEDVFKGPVELADLPEGEYELEASGDGFIPARGGITVRKGETSEWAPYSTGTIAFDVKPAGATLRLDGKEPIRTGEALEGLAPGSYTGVLGKPGYRDAQVSFQIAAGRITTVAASLPEYERGRIVLPRLGVPVSLRIGEDLVAGTETADGSTVFEGIPAGGELDVTFECPALKPAGTTPTLRLSVKEGGTVRPELPIGRFSLPWIPAGSVLEIEGAAGRLETEPRDLGFVSPLLLAGRYSVKVSGGGLSEDIQAEVDVPAGGTATADRLRDSLVADLLRSKERDEKTLSVRKTKTVLGYASLGTGVLGAAGTLAAYLIGSQAMDSYRAATDSATAAARWENVELWRALFFVSAGIGGAALGVSPVFLAGRPDPDVLEDSIRTLDEGIRALKP